MIDNLFSSALNMSFTASYVILFVLLARLFLKKSPKIFSYALWSVVLFRLICPYSFESVLSIFSLTGRTMENFRPFSDEFTTFSSKIETPANIPDGTVIENIHAVNSAPVLQSIFTFVWLLGIMVLLAYSIVSLLKLKSKLKCAIHSLNNIYIFDGLKTAFVLGIFSPKIYLPADITAKEKEYILLHEQTHIRRFDHVIKIISFLVLCVHWFNPLVWIAFFLSAKDMEMSCDEAVIKKLGNDVKKDYSNSLLSLATGRHMIYGTPLAFGEGDTKGRIKNVLNYKKPTFWIILVTVLAIICITVGLISNPLKAKIQIDGTIYYESGENIMELPYNAFEIGILYSVLHGFNKEFDSNFQAISLNAKYAGNPIYQDPEKKNTIYLKDYTGYFIPFVSKEKEKAYDVNTLWENRTKYIGDNSAVGNIISALIFPENIIYDGFELYTEEYPYTITVHLKTDTETRNFYSEPLHQHIFTQNAVVMFSLIENAEIIQFVFNDGVNSNTFQLANGTASAFLGEDYFARTETREGLEKVIKDISQKVLEQTEQIKQQQVN